MFSGEPVNKLEKINILLMNGSAHTSDLMREMFLQLGFTNIEVVHDGFEAIQLMKQKLIHLIITDWELRVRRNKNAPASKDVLPLNGAEFVKRLRQSPQSPNPFVAVVMVLNQAASGYESQARDAGVNEIVPHPLNARDLCDSVIRLIDHQRHFITAPTYKGPCRRREVKPLSSDIAERRIRQIRLVRRNEYKAGAM